MSECKICCKTFKNLKLHIAKKHKPEPKSEPKKTVVATGWITELDSSVSESYYDMTEAEGYAYAYGSVGCERK